MATDGPNATNTKVIGPSGILWNRTYIGLLIAQFLAAFNDQAIHASAMFFAINTQTLSEAKAISLMPILFYAPWAIFCTLAGYLADRYSKRVSLVFWKFAEIAITALALLGFYLGSHGDPQVGSWIVLSTVFLMGMHSAFFVPAKYGVMPEILKPHLLSRGNGVLESLSFLAVILGTVSGGVLSFLFLRQETIIGVILLVLAIVGALASLLIQRMPAANPDRPFPAYLYGPLWKSIQTLFSSRPLIFAVIGLAFFTFIVAFMRATVYMLGESQNPRWDELRTSAIVGTVALGIGLGSPLAGWLSGRKVELGLIPLGAIGMIFGCVMAAFTVGYVPALVAFIVLIGFSTGFYLVPLFTLLQHRAPKASKGDMIATSNFINVTGAIAASAFFFILVMLAKMTGLVEQVPAEDAFVAGNLERIEFHRGRPVYFEVLSENGERRSLGRLPNPEEPSPTVIQQLLGEDRKTVGTPAPAIEIGRGVTTGEQVKVTRYLVHEVEHLVIRDANDPPAKYYDFRRLPQFLFLGAGLMTLITVLILLWRLPDLRTRALRVVRSLRGERVHVDGIHHLPSVGPVLLIMNETDAVMQEIIVTAPDRYTRFFATSSETVDSVACFVRSGHVAAIAMEGEGSTTFIKQLRERIPDLTYIPTYMSRSSEVTHLVFGPIAPLTTDLETIRQAIADAINHTH